MSAAKKTGQKRGAEEEEAGSHAEKKQKVDTKEQKDEKKKEDKKDDLACKCGETAMVVTSCPGCSDETTRCLKCRLAHFIEAHPDKLEILCGRCHRDTTSLKENKTKKTCGSCTSCDDDEDNDSTQENGSNTFCYAKGSTWSCYDAHHLRNHASCDQCDECVDPDDVGDFACGDCAEQFCSDTCFTDHMEEKHTESDFED